MFDHVGIIATDDQLQLFKSVFNATEVILQDDSEVGDISLQKILVDEHTKLKGTDIRSSSLRERTNGLVVGIERGKDRILNPDSATILEWGDIIWIVGDKKKVQQLKQEK